VSTTKLLIGDCAAVPVNGVRLVSVVAGPHASGLASGASGPPVKRRIALLNGCSGFSENVAVNRPVVSSGTTEPFRRTSTPYLVDSALRYIVYGGPVIGPVSGPVRGPPR
jgi:hypothetical protein